jgi:hypothetical protein
VDFSKFLENVDANSSMEGASDLAAKLLCQKLFPNQASACGNHSTSNLQRDGAFYRSRFGQSGATFNPYCCTCFTIREENDNLTRGTQLDSILP